MSMLFPLTLLACAPDGEVDPREGTWVGVLGLDEGGSVDFTATVEVTVDESAWMLPGEVSSVGSGVATDATVSCEGVFAGGATEPASTYDWGNFRVDVEGSSADTSWDFRLDGEVEGDEASGEGFFSWYAEADFTGTEIPLSCQGAGEFTATRQ